jgi:hypothetical protein
VSLIWKFTKAVHFGKSWVKFEFGRNKKGKVFGILSQLKNMSKSKDVHAQNETLLSSTLAATFDPDKLHYRLWRHYV